MVRDFLKSSRCLKVRTSLALLDGSVVVDHFVHGLQFLECTFVFFVVKSNTRNVCTVYCELLRKISNKNMCVSLQCGLNLSIAQ